MTRESLTTRDCANLLNAALELRDGITARFILGEVQDGRLLARVYHRAGRRRARIRVHPDDFLAYCDQHYARLTQRVRDTIAFHEERRGR